MTAPQFHARSRQHPDINRTIAFRIVLHVYRYQPHIYNKGVGSSSECFWEKSRIPDFPKSTQRQIKRPENNEWKFLIGTIYSSNEALYLLFPLFKKFTGHQFLTMWIRLCCKCNTLKSTSWQKLTILLVWNRDCKVFLHISHLFSITAPKGTNRVIILPFQFIKQFISCSSNEASASKGM